MTIAILAGGQSSRMGTPKAELMLRGQPVVDYLLDRWSIGTGVSLVIAPGQDPPPGSTRCSCIVHDPIAGLGPLRGILSALENCSEGSADEIVVVTTIDMPNVRVEMLSWLEDRLLERPALRGVMIERSAGGERIIEPFPSAFRRSAATIIAAELEQQRRAVRSLLRHEQHFAAIPAPMEWGEANWLNLTTPEDVAAFNRG